MGLSNTKTQPQCRTSRSRKPREAGEDLEPSPGSALPHHLWPALEATGHGLVHTFGLRPSGRTPGTSSREELAHCHTAHVSGCGGDRRTVVTGELLSVSLLSPALMDLSSAAAEAEGCSRCVLSPVQVCAQESFSIGAASWAPP